MPQKLPVRAAAVLATSALPLSLAGVGLAGAAAAAPTPAPKRTVLTGTRPHWATTAVGRAARSRTVSARVYLRPHRSAELQRLASEVSDPASASYRHFLSAAQYRARFAPTAADVAAVRRWVDAAGLSVTGVASGNRYVLVRGSVAATEKAFDTPLALFRRGRATLQAPAHDLTVPAALGGTVLSVSGLDDGEHRVRPGAAAAPPPDGFRNARPCSDYYGQRRATTLPPFDGAQRPYAVCGYIPRQLRAAYTAGTSLTGAGATVAITDAYAAPTIRSDSDTYARRHGDQPFRPGQFSQVLPGSFRRQAQCDPSGWYGEETLDVQAVHGMAPAAKVIYYASRSCYDDDFLDTLARVVDDNRASIVSNSWADLEANTTADTARAYQSIFLQGAVQGIGFFFSSGDDGDERAASGQVQVDYPASDPLATAVGGTSLAVGPTGYLWESGWGTRKFALDDAGKAWTPQGFLYGAGGGFSALFRRPAYQVGVVRSTAGGRAVPDVGLDADPTTGMLIGETQTFPSGVQYGEYRIGGTSLAAPLMAGVQALTTQRVGRLGFANPRIYSLARARTGAFRDVTAAHDGEANVRPDFVNRVSAAGGIAYSVRTFDDDSSLATGPGWDPVTGVGSPTLPYLGG